MLKDVASEVAVPLPLECSFRLLGEKLPVNNGYLIFAAICTVLDDRLPPGVGLFSVGSKLYDGEHLYLRGDAVLRFRLTQPELPSVLQLAGKGIDVGGCSVLIGTSSIRVAPSSPTLYSRLVTFKNAMDEGSILQHAMGALKDLGITAEVSLPGNRRGQYVGLPQRRIVKIRNDKVVGYGLTISNLNPGDAQKLLVHGMGGRRHMGCGIFEAVPEEQS